MNTDRIDRHPCFSKCSRSARLHLPIAYSCNISCNYCSRSYDCQNESRPGVTSAVLSVADSIERFRQVKAAMPNLSVVGVAGPGDALANFDSVSEIFKKIRRLDSDVLFCLSTNGLYLNHFADKIKKLGITHITVTINTIDPHIGSLLYDRINYWGKVYYGQDGAKLLLQQQLEGIREISRLGIIVKVNTVIVQGINEACAIKVAKKANELGAYIGNVTKHIPINGTSLGHIDSITDEKLFDIQKKCSEYIKQMYHCRQCRADAAGSLMT